MSYQLHGNRLRFNFSCLLHLYFSHITSASATIFVSANGRGTQ